jgi:hypothetical protein
MLGQHLSSQFSYDSDSNAFSAWASELGSYMFKQLYEDACDVGLEIVSCRTGAVSKFYLETEHVNDDNDITHWTLKPTTDTIRKFPLLKTATVTVFNT